MNEKMEVYVLSNPMQKSANLVTIKCIFDELDFYKKHEYVDPIEDSTFILHILWVMDIKNKFYEKLKQTGTYGLIENYLNGFEVANFLFRKEDETESDYESRLEQWADNIDIEIDNNFFIDFKCRFTEAYNNNK